MEQFTALQSTLHQEGLKSPLRPKEVKNIDAYWRAANYLSVGCDSGVSVYAAN